MSSTTFLGIVQDIPDQFLNRCNLGKEVNVKWKCELIKNSNSNI